MFNRYKNLTFKEKCINKNKRIIAKYLALYTECSNMNKCMVTLTPYDGKLSTTIKLRKEFFKTLNKVKRYKTDGDLTIKYFTNIEFTSKSIPHLHIQLFYTNKSPIVKTFEKLVCKGFINDQSNSISFGRKKRVNFNYVIKDYLTYNENLEKFKSGYKNVNFYTSSCKTISNSIVKYLYKKLKFNTKNRYKEILEYINKGLILIKTEKTKNYEHMKINSLYLLCSSKVGSKYVYIFKTMKKGKMCTYKIKKLIKGRKTKKVKFISRWKRVVLEY